VDLEGLQEFKVGGMIIALKTGLPVAPVIVTGTRCPVCPSAMVSCPAVERLAELGAINVAIHGI